MAVALLLCTSLVSCSRDDLADVQCKYPLELTAGGLQAVITSAQASTRATVDDDWNGVSTVAVQVGYDVKSYNVTSADGGKTATLSSDNPFYWERANETKTITAWHPYSKFYPTDWTVKADQSTAASYQASDLVRGKLTDLAFADRNDPSKNKMTFAHQTAKVVVNLVAGDGVTLDANTSVKLLNISGVEKGSTITFYKPAANTHTYLALLNGQLIRAKSSFIQVETSGGTFVYKPQTSKTLQAGTAYTYDITVKANGIEVTETTGSEWTDGGSENVASYEIYKASDLKLGDYYYSDGTWSDGGLRKLYADGTMKWEETTPQPESGKTVVGIVFYVGQHENDKSDYSSTGIGQKNCHGYAVALTDVHNDDNDRLRWEYGPNRVYNRSVNTFTDNDDWQGYSNSLKFHEFVNKEDNKTAGWEMKHFPAALACETYGNRTVDQDGNPTDAYDWQKPLAAPSNTSGWFLPTYGQLTYLYQNRSVLSSRMDVVKSSVPANCDYKDKIKWFNYYYWSSTEIPNYPDDALNMSLRYGDAYPFGKFNRYGVRAVLAF